MMVESDLALPVKNYFQSLGYEVKSEVLNCDIVAEKGGEVIIVELKKSFSLKLIFQAIDRQKICGNVFVCVPRPVERQNSNRWRSCLNLCKRLDLGLITVAIDSGIKTVDVLAEPKSVKIKNSQKKADLLKELAGRTGDLNTAGINKKKIVTAYRERSVEIACVLNEHGELEARNFRLLGFQNAAAILGANYYGWFLRVRKGTYVLTPKGREEIKNYKELADYYTKKYKNIDIMRKACE